MNIFRTYMDIIESFLTEYDQMMGRSDHDWEARHDFIQYLFPNDEPSANLADAPVLTAKVREVWAGSSNLKLLHRNAFIRFLEHVGLRFDPQHGTIKVVNSGLVLMRLVQRNHNQWRITRVLRSMRLLGQQQLSNELYKVLLEISDSYGGVNTTTLDYWRGVYDPP